MENSDYNLRKLGGKIYNRGFVIGFEKGMVDVEWTNLETAKGHPHKLFSQKRLMRVDVIDLAIEIRETESKRTTIKRRILIKKYKNENKTKS